MEELIEIANFRLGVKDVPAFEGSDGGASRMLNYHVDYDGEVIPRPGHIGSTREITYLSGTSVTETELSGPIVATENSEGVIRVFRLPVGSSYVLEQDKLFVSAEVPAEGFWVDLYGEGDITTDNVFSWGPVVRPGSLSTDELSAVTADLDDTTIISHPTFIGLDTLPPSPDNPIIVKFKMSDGATGDAVRIQFRQDDALGDTEFWSKLIRPLTAGSKFEVTWRGEDEQDAEVDRYVSQEQFNDIYMEVIFGTAVDPAMDDDYSFDTNQGGIVQAKRRYYLAGHREADIGGGIAASIQAGVQVFSAGAAFSGPYAAAAGGAVAAAGIAGTLISNANQGDRVKIPRERLFLTPAETGEIGFHPGPISFCVTYSDTEDRLVETLPSYVGTILVYDFEEQRDGQRIKQRLQFVLPLAGNIASGYGYAKYLNIYAARTPEIFDRKITPQSTGLEFQMIAQIEREQINGLWEWGNMQDGLFVNQVNGVTRHIYHWENETVIENKYLETTDNDTPPAQIKNIISYGSRIWGVNTEDESIIYSKLGPHGFHAFPNENALIPQHIRLDDRHSKIVKIYPSPNDSLLYVFKRDRIHFIRGHGDIKGLHSPNTPIDINLDASVKKENIGTYAPDSITTLKDTILFLGSDKILYSLNGLSVTPFSLSIQPHIDRYTDDELEGITAFEYRNCYHLCLPNEMLVLDLQKRYWTIYDLAIDHVFWLQHSGRVDGENTMFAIDSSDNLFELFVDSSMMGVIEPTSCEWESNPIKVPYESVISGIHVYHDESNKGPLTISVKVNNGDYKEYTFNPRRHNRFRQGVHAKGHRIQVKVADSNPDKLKIDRIAIETTQ